MLQLWPDPQYAERVKFHRATSISQGWFAWRVYIPALPSLIDADKTKQAASIGAFVIDSASDCSGQGAGINSCYEFDFEIVPGRSKSDRPGKCCPDGTECATSCPYLYNGSSRDLLAVMSAQSGVVRTISAGRGVSIFGNWPGHTNGGGIEPISGGQYHDLFLQISSITNGNTQVSWYIDTVDQPVLALEVSHPARKVEVLASLEEIDGYGDPGGFPIKSNVQTYFDSIRVYGLPVTLPTGTANAQLLFVKAGDVWTMNTDGSGQRQLTSVGDASAPRLANGVVVFKHASQIWRTDIQGSNPSAVANTGGVLDFGLRPDGQQLVLTYDGMNGSSYNNYQMYTLNIDGSGKVLINNTPGYHNAYPHWGRDGYVYFGQAPVGTPTQQHVYRIPQDGVNNAVSLAIPLSQYPAQGTNNRVAYLSEVPPAYSGVNRRIRIMNPDGSGDIPAAGSPAGVMSPLGYDFDTDAVYYETGGVIYRLDAQSGAITPLASGVTVNTGVSYGKVKN